MFRKMSNWLRRSSPGWVALLALVIFALFTALVLPAQASKAAGQNGKAGSPDLSLWYTPSDLNRMAEASGEAGRQEYVRSHFTFDLAWPLVYTFFLVTAISWLFGRGFPLASRWQLANLAPLAAMLLDFLENISTSLVMLAYPQTLAVIAWLAPIFTFLKWMAVGLSIILLLLGAVAATLSALRKIHR
jgi:hypothetical protein